jgi:hypothetical protein
MRGSGPSSKWRAFTAGLLLGLSCLLVGGLAGASLMEADFDRDGLADSLSVGRFDLHLFVTRETSPDPAGPSRHFDAPATYVRVVAGQAFASDRGFALESGGGRESPVSVVRVKKPDVRMSVRIEDWRGWARVTIESPESTRLDETVTERAFEMIEDLLYRDLPRARSLPVELGPTRPQDR